MKRLRLLQSSKGRRLQGQALLEGCHLIEEALRADFEIDVVCSTTRWQQQHPLLFQQVAQRASRSVSVSEAVLAAIATTKTPDGIIATGPRTPPLQPQFPCTLGVAVEALQDPGNLGTVIRTAAATDADGLWLSSDSVALDHPKVLRASAGQWFQLPMMPVPSLEEALHTAQGQGVQIVATHLEAQKSHWEVNWRRPSLIVIGNEGAGLSARVGAIADAQVRIPLWRGVESLNAAISLAVILYEAQRQRSLE